MTRKTLVVIACLTLWLCTGLLYAITTYLQTLEGFGGGCFGVGTSLCIAGLVVNYIVPEKT